MKPQPATPPPRRPLSRKEAQARFLLAVLKDSITELKATIREESRKSRSQS